MIKTLIKQCARVVQRNDWNRRPMTRSQVRQLYRLRATIDKVLMQDMIEAEKSMEGD
jgi:hypothetical protein